MNQLNELLNKALDKANQDLNNEKIEVNYTPEFLIELLEEIKEVANAKPKNDVYSIKKEYSRVFDKYRYYIYRNDFVLLGYDTIEEAELIIRYKESLKLDKMTGHRKEVANV